VDTQFLENGQMKTTTIVVSVAMACF